MGSVIGCSLLAQCTYTQNYDIQLRKNENAPRLQFLVVEMSEPHVPVGQIPIGLLLA